MFGSQEHVMLNKKAFTLVEVLVGMVIMIIVFLGTFQAITMYVNHNLAAAIRNEAVKIAQECSEKLKNYQFCTNTSSSGDIITDHVIRKIRNVQKDFTIEYPNPFNFDDNQPNLVNIRVYYEYNGKQYVYQFSTVVYKTGS